MTAGIYLHIPFCRSKCFYCDFPSFDCCESLFDDYIAALCREIAVRAGHHSPTAINTVYIGGGTPTLLSQRQLARVSEALYRYWDIAGDAEFSIEANPGTVDLPKLRFLRSLGVNRISFGVQSFNDGLLKSIGRIHSARQAFNAIYSAKLAEFSNINIDLMYGLPRQTTDDWKHALATAVTLEIQHISSYGLKVEEGTPFYALEQQGCLELPSEEDDESMYDTVTCFLPEQGFLRYEISNYALPGCECQHNLKYWRYQSYIGIGAGAHSFDDGRRFANTSDVAEYISRIRGGQSACAFEERPVKEEAMAEFVFLALRTVSGLSFAAFKKQFGIDFLHQYTTVANDLNNSGLLDIRADGAVLTNKGMKFGNAAFAAFLPGKS